MKTYLIVSFVPLPDVDEGQPTVVAASARWDGLAAAGKVSILQVDEDFPLPSVTVGSVAVADLVDDAVVNVLEHDDGWLVDFADRMPADGTIREVLDWVDRAESALERAARAFEALQYEYAGKNRTTLVDALAAIVGDTDDQG